MDMESLRIFRAVAAELSITRAAVRLERVQSNVTTRIQQLEADLGVPLFVRTGKRLSLSSAGLQFLGYAQRLLALEDEARQMVAGTADGGALRMGSMESTAASRLPGVLAAYHARHPHTRLEISTAPSRQLLEQVYAGTLDCGLLALPANMCQNRLRDEMDLMSRPVWRETLILLLPSAEKNPKKPADVQVRSLAAFAQGCTYRALAEDLLGIGATPGWRVQEMGSYHAMIACVAAGACAALLPQSVLALAKPPRGLKMLKAGEMDTCLVWRADYDTPAFARMQSQLQPTTP